METTAQVDLVLYHLADHGGITPQDAMYKFGCQRLAARVHDLRGYGWEIDTQTVDTPGGRATTRYVPSRPQVRRDMVLTAKEDRAGK